VSNNRIELVGWTELLTQLRNLPADLTHEAAGHVDDTVEQTASSLIQSYPRSDTGNLRKGVKWGTTQSGFGVSGQVKSTAKTSHLWEFGTESRKTRKGWERGRMPAHYNQGLVGIASRNRKKLKGQLIDVVRKAGFDVQDNG
jgi:hypothetical protein